MKPEVGKWYTVRYSKKESKRGYHGPALCVAEPDCLSDNAYHFVEPATQHLCKLNKPSFVCILFADKDILEECEPMPSYLDLVTWILYTGYEIYHPEFANYIEYLEKRNNANN